MTRRYGYGPSDVGGYAVGSYARPRGTKDIDLLVDRSEANARRTLTALQRFLGTRPRNITVAKLRHPQTLIVLGPTTAQ